MGQTRWDLSSTGWEEKLECRQRLPCNVCVCQASGPGHCPLCDSGLKGTLNVVPEPAAASPGDLLDLTTLGSCYHLLSQHVQGQGALTCVSGSDMTARFSVCRLLSDDVPMCALQVNWV